MTTFKSQAAKDLDNILALGEISEDVVLGVGASAIRGKAVIDIDGRNDSEWGGGSAITATAVLPKSMFPLAPKIHDSLAVDGGRAYLVDSLAGESSAAWTVSLVAELKAR